MLDRSSRYTAMASLLLLLIPLLRAQAFACRASATETFLDQAYRFEIANLALSPVAATQSGYHGDDVDNKLDDYSPEGIAAERALLATGRQCFRDEHPNTAEDAADLELIQNNIDYTLFALDSLQTYRYHPQEYVELIGSGLFFPLTITHGSEEQRLTSVLSRMEQVPRLLNEARTNLKEADPVFIDTAVSENAGNVDVIQQIGKRIPAGSPLRPRYTIVSKAALEAINSYSAWLTNDLAHRPHEKTWRTGPENYAQIFRFALGPGTQTTPDAVLTAAEADLTRTRSEMYAHACPLYHHLFPGKPSPTDCALPADDPTQNQIIATVIDHINHDHVQPGQLLATVRSQAAGIRAFIVKKDLVTLSSRDNMHIVATPAFLRGIYSVAGFHAAPALDPTQEAEYWVTPIDPKMPPAQADSKLREYNNWMLQYLTMHEALPGHYTQFEHANDIQPPSRRIIRALLGNGPYIEGWGEYGVREMEDAGYADDDPRFVLMVEKIRLRVITNAILDINLQSRQMTDEQALDLMEHKAFQTEAEAKGKLLRAKLSAGQLITYYVGYHQWIDLRQHIEQEQHDSFNLKRFNDAALDEGPLPVPLLTPLLEQKLLAK